MTKRKSTKSWKTISETHFSMRPKNADINFVEHMVGIADIFREDIRLSPFHISLYYALFHVWNQSMFSTPISIARSEIMKSAHIGSANTYVKCLKELSELGYIIYEPSHNPMKGSLVYLYRIDTTAEQVMKGTCTDSIQVVNNSYTTLVQVLRHYLNYTNNNKLSKTEQTSKDELYSSRKTQKRFSPPSQNEVVDFFKEKKANTEEAEKFFNHFESNGWKVGGKTPMKNWQAAANNWMLRSKNFAAEKSTVTNRLNVNQNKDYGEPL